MTPKIIVEICTVGGVTAALLFNAAFYLMQARVSRAGAKETRAGACSGLYFVIPRLYRESHAGPLWLLYLYRTSAVVFLLFFAIIASVFIVKA